MILTIREKYNKNDGADLPMFSRSGKSTINQYLQFSQGNKHEVTGKINLIDNGWEDEDTGLEIGEKKPLDIALAMQKIEDEIKKEQITHRLRKKQFGPCGSKRAKEYGNSQQKIMKPIEYLQDTDFRRNVSVPFKTSTRTSWQNAHSNKTKPPDVGKYTPIYKQIEPVKKMVVIRDEHQHIGQKRIQDKEEQQNHICLQQIKILNYPVKHENSQAQRLAAINKKLKEMEENAMKIEKKFSQTKQTSFDQENESQNEAVEDDDQQLDMLNLYVKELRESKFLEVRNKSNSTPQPCQFYNRTYLSNGKQVEVKPFKDQLSGVQKLFIEDWKRVGYSYKTSFQGETHHLVKDINSTGFRVEENSKVGMESLIELSKSIKKKENQLFTKQVSRKDSDYINTLNESRFESINKAPSQLSSVHRVPGCSFKKQTQRVSDLFGKSDSTSCFYDSKKEATMSRLDRGIPILEKVQPRRAQLSQSMVESCYDEEKVIDAKTTRFKPKYVNLTNFKGMTSRDDSMLKTIDMYYNIQLENTKEERESEMKEKALHQKQLPIYFKK